MRGPGIRLIRIYLLALMTLGLAGCAVYHAKPLPKHPNLAGKVSDLRVSAQKLHAPGLKPHPFNPAKGLDATNVATLAVLNNPGLKAKRAQLGVSRAQLFAAGLLPDPTLSGSVGFPTTPGYVKSYTAGLGIDIQKLITRHVRQAKAKAGKQQINLELLWQEWQVAQQARMLFIERRAQIRLKKILAQTITRDQQLYARSYQALQHHDLTLSNTSGKLVTLVSAQQQMRQLETQINKTRHSLNALLGLKPDVRLKLKGQLDPSTLSPAQFKKAEKNIQHRRPDLLALAAGYHSQEAAVREAILKQFPSFTVGVSKARDTSSINTIGFNVSLKLPLFNANRGNIAIARATRKQLRDAYQARIDSAESQAHQMWRKTRILARQLHEIQQHLPELKHMAKQGRQAYISGNLNAGTYVSLEVSALSTEQQALRLQAELTKSQVALQTLLGMPMAPLTQSKTS